MLEKAFATLICMEKRRELTIKVNTIKINKPARKL